MFYFFIFMLGASITSFAMCFGKDWAHQKVVLNRRSQCDICHTQLKWIDLIPILSILLNRFKCRYCSAKLSILYLFGEMLGGISMIMIYWIYPQMPIIYIFLINLAFQLLIVIDWEAYWIPDLLQVAVLFLLLYAQTTWTQIFFAGFIACLLFILCLLFPRSFGMGDVKLLSILSLGITISDFPNYLMLASGSALLYSLTMKKGPEKRIPFGPFLILAFLMTNLIRC